MEGKVLYPVKWNEMVDCSVKKVDGNLAVDDRGTVRFVNDFNFEGVKRFYQVENHNSENVIRAWHGHFKEGKYVYVAKGAIILGYSWLNGTGSVFPSDDPQKVVLSADKPSVVYIPPSYINGFRTLTNDTIVQFFSTSTLEESKNDDYRFPYNYYDERGYKGFWEVENR